MSHFQSGDRVVYVPTHAHGDRQHKDCETGMVSRVGADGTVFVVFDDPGSMGRAKACYPESLVHE